MTKRMQGRGQSRLDDVIGLDIGAGELKVAVVRDEQVIRIGRAPLPEGVIVDGILRDPEQLAQALKRLWRKFGLRSKRVNFSIANRRVLFRNLSLPRSGNHDDIQLALVANAEVWFAPMRLEEMVIDFSEQDAKVLTQVPLEVVAADKVEVTSYIKALRRARLVPIACQFGPLAETKVLVSPRSPHSAHLIVNVGAEKTSLIVVNGPDALFGRLIDTAGNDFTRAIAERLQCGFQEAEQLKCTFGLTGSSSDDPAALAAAQSAMLEPVDRLVQAIADTRAFFEQNSGGLVVSGLTVTGGGGRLSGLAEQIALTLHFQDVSPLTPRQSFESVPEIDVYATAVALAWKKVMSLMPPVVGVAVGDKKNPVKPRVDKKRAAVLAKQLRKRRSARANPLMIGLLVGAVLLGGEFMYGKRLSAPASGFGVAALNAAPASPVYGKEAGDATRAGALTYTAPPAAALAGLQQLLATLAVQEPQIQLTATQITLTGRLPRGAKIAALSAAAAQITGVSVTGTPQLSGKRTFTLILSKKAGV